MGGISNTVPVTMEEMIYHCRVVMRTVKYALVVGDLPFLSCQADIRDAIFNAGLLIMKNGGIDAVKLEGGKEIAAIVKAIVDAGVPVMGHIGLTTQAVSKLGGFKVQGTDTATARKFVGDAVTLESAGIFMLTLEGVPDCLADFISKKLAIPVTGIGSGPYPDRQALNLYDLVGLFEKFTPKFVKRYVNLSQEILKALQNFKEEVEKGVFPGAEHSSHMKDEVLMEVLEGQGKRLRS